MSLSSSIVRAFDDQWLRAKSTRKWIFWIKFSDGQLKVNGNIQIDFYTCEDVFSSHRNVIYWKSKAKVIKSFIWQRQKKSWRKVEICLVDVIEIFFEFWVVWWIFVLRWKGAKRNILLWFQFMTTRHVIFIFHFFVTFIIQQVGLISNFFC